MKKYDGKYIVKFEKIDNVIVETYIEVSDGNVFLITYVNHKEYSKHLITVV